MHIPSQWAVTSKKELPAITFIKSATSALLHIPTSKTFNANTFKWSGRALGEQYIPTLLLPCVPFLAVHAIFMCPHTLAQISYNYTDD